MSQNIFVAFAIGCAIRCYLVTTKYAATISNRVEIATPLNAYKRVQEGIHLYQNGVDPYDGDLVHETPIVLLTLVHLFNVAPKLIPLLYIALDLLTGVVLYRMSCAFVKRKLMQEKEERPFYAKNTDILQMQDSDLSIIPCWVLYAHLFNPLSILNCVGLTSTVFSNLLLALTLYGLAKHKILWCLFPLALEAMRSLYPVVLLSPIIITFCKSSIRKAGAIVIMFTSICIIITIINVCIMNSWTFLDGTLGFIFFYRDLQPNIGLFWYFFTEMFEHFRTMFLITFQMNATVLYLTPLSLKLRKEPMLLATVLIALTAIFRSYPCLGDVSFYLALMPLWRRFWKFMAHNFVVFGFFVVTLSIMPALWYLWIYAGSANANFYFGATLAFCTGQIFLVTDLLFAQVKRQFCLYNGLKVYIDGKEAKIILE